MAERNAVPNAARNILSPLAASKTRQLIMRHIITIITVILLTLNNDSQAQSLRRTIRKYTKVMTNSNANQQDFLENLRPLIDPSSNVDSLCLDYYTHWKYNASINSFPLKTKIKKIKKVTTEKATVLISNIWHLSEDGNYYFLSKTTWTRKNGKWYRSGEAAKIIERRKI